MPRRSQTCGLFSGTRARSRILLWWIRVSPSVFDGQGELCRGLASGQLKKCVCFFVQLFRLTMVMPWHSWRRCFIVSDTTSCCRRLRKPYHHDIPSAESTIGVFPYRKSPAESSEGEGERRGGNSAKPPTDARAEHHVLTWGNFAPAWQLFFTLIIPHVSRLGSRTEFTVDA